MKKFKNKFGFPFTNKNKKLLLILAIIVIIGAVILYFRYKSKFSDVLNSEDQNSLHANKVIEKDLF